MPIIEATNDPRHRPLIRCLFTILSIQNKPAFLAVELFIGIVYILASAVSALPNQVFPFNSFQTPNTTPNICHILQTYIGGFLKLSFLDGLLPHFVTCS